MFNKNTRKLLMDPKPLYFRSPEMSNPSKTWKDFKRITITAVNDMALLYPKLSPEKRDELYNLQNFKKLFDTLLSTREANSLEELDIAVYAIEKSINVFKKRYIDQNINTLVLASVITDYLEKTLEICKDISYKEKLKLHLPEFENRKIGYLCSWNEIVGREKKYLLNFIEYYLDYHPLELNINYYDSGKRISGYFNGLTEEKEEPTKYYVKLIMNNIKDEATLVIDDGQGFKESQKFIVKSKGNDYLLFYDSDVIKGMEFRGMPHNIFMSY